MRGKMSKRYTNFTVAKDWALHSAYEVKNFVSLYQPSGCERWCRNMREMIRPLSKDSSRTARMIDTWQFSFLVALIILLNSLNVGLQAQLAADDVTGRVTVSDWVSIDTANLLNVIFCWLYLAEVLLRLWVDRSAYFRASGWRWNLLDLFLVTFAFADVYVDDIGNITVLRQLRMFRMVRVLQVLRLLRTFDVLREMVLSIFNSVLALVWIIVVLLMLLYIFSLYFVQATVNALQELSPQGLPEDKESLMLQSLDECFGGVPKAMLSLFMAISGGKDWADVMAPVSEHLGAQHVAVFMFFIIFMLFGVLNIVTGVFVEQACSLAEMDRDQVVHQVVQRQKELSNDIKTFFSEMDTDNSGMLTRDEFLESLTHTKVIAYLEHLGLEVDNAEYLFQLLDEQSAGEVSIDAFVEGCMRLRGGAKSIDVALLLFESRRIRRALEIVARRVPEVAAKHTNATTSPCDKT